MNFMSALPKGREGEHSDKTAFVALCFLLKLPS